MNALVRKLVTRNRDSLLKESLQTQLMSCVKDIQLDQAHSGRFQSSAEATQALCTAIEAIFIHGIKETLADRMAIAIGDPDARPEPNFWPALLVFSHREIVDQISKLTFVCTDVGRCRAWIRLALNDSLLSSYLQSMQAQNSALNTFYKRAAYLRDMELLDMFITVVSSIESYPFNLVCNSSLLNLWANQPLLMSGVWSPAMKANPIQCTRGTDIVSTLVTDDFPTSDHDSLSSVSVSSYTGSPSVAFDEDDFIKRILLADKSLSEEISSSDRVLESKEDSPCDSKCDISASEEASSVECTDNTNTTTTDSNISQTQLPRIENEKGKICMEKSCDQTENEIKSLKPPVQSYHSLVESYNKTSTNPTQRPDLKDLLQKFPNPATQPLETNSAVIDSDLVCNMDFEVVLNNVEPSDLPEFGSLMMQVTRIANEPGLDSQDYKCKTCAQHVGVNFMEASVCGLSGAYYCLECYQTTDPAQQHWVIPARVIYSWDFRQYSVSRNAANFLSQTQLYPLFDLNTLNDKIYHFVKEMAQIKEMREQLKYLGDYLKCCKGSNLQTLQRLVWPRDYLYENIHLYSLADLLQVPSGTLEGVLRNAVALARSHVVACTFCNQQGFICEICNNPNVIFPFDFDSTYRCSKCGSVYHAECLENGMLCKKCSRIQKRVLQHSSSST